MDGCFLDGFNLTCDNEDQVAYLGRNKTLKVLEINLSQGEVLVQKRISIICKNDSGLITDEYHPHFRLSHSRSFYLTVSNKNKFTAIGCATFAIIDGETNQHNYTSGCASFCDEDSIDNSTQCTGMGCCQTSIPSNLRSFTTSFLSIGNSSGALNFSQCSYAFVAKQNWFNFSSSYANSKEFGEVYRPSDRGVPMVIDWVLGNETCMEATTKLTYACRSKNSLCIEAPNVLGYRCNCLPGYEGNPYLPEGCQDIDECKYPSTYPCKGGRCHNIDGNYTCSCKPGTHSDDPKNMQCSRNSSSNMVIGISICSIFVIICTFILLNGCQKRKLEKEKERFFKENGGMILYQQILSKQVDTVIIFTLEDLEKATNNFDKSRELGKGAHGTVYKGILSDSKVVAVKRSKIINMGQNEEFVQEIVILSQINHKNVVRLLGCCLEVEVPILVYEFIPNGTLFHFIHGNCDIPPVSLEIRLRIAQESAEALAYLHLATNHPIVHGDVKSPNILLDGNCTAKVTDFGASRMLPKEANQFMTVVQGTLGYLDPEYLQERKLTENSDVYSFGVVLLELITGKKAIYSEGPKEGESLASSFLQAVKDHRVEGILDTSIMGVGMEEPLQEAVELGRQCLNVKGEERPSMSQVADKLKAIRSNWRELLLLKHNETELVIQRSSVASLDQSPSSMYCTTPMLGMDIEAPRAEHASSTYVTAEYV
ncbi:unnamed protein product [Urochloa humidicola]